MASKVSFTYVAPLFRFRAVDAPVRLPGGLLIRELTDQERSDLCVPVQQVWQGESLVGSEGGFGLSWVEQARGVGAAATSADERLAVVEERFRAASTALRLVAPGDVGMGLIGVWIGERGIHRARFVHGKAPAWYPYGLERNDVSVLKEILERLRGSLAQKKGLRRAVARFDLAYERASFEDKVIDFWVALEGLFLTGEMGELSFKGAVRIAHFLGESPDGRWRIYQDAKKSYSVRSKIVHGERLKVSSPDLEMIARQTEEMLRIALRAVVLDPNSLDPASLDERAIRGVPEPGTRRLQLT